MIGIIGAMDAQFKDYILQNVGSDEITISELQEICK